MGSGTLSARQARGALVGETDGSPRVVQAPGSRIVTSVALVCLLASCSLLRSESEPAKAEQPPAAEQPAESAATPESQPAEPATVQPAEPAPQAEAAPSPPVQRNAITLAAVGDIMLGTDYPKNTLPDDDGVGFLADVTSTLSAADIAFGNLEGVLLDGGEPVKQCKSPENCFLFRTPTRYATYLRQAGFDVMSLANNHARDFGEEGRDSSMKALDAAGIVHSGREGDVASWSVKGRRVAMIAFAPNVGAHQLNDLPAARERVRDLASQPEIVIVSVHGGAEGEGAERLPFEREKYQGEDRGDVVEFARAMIDEGADIVLGHGPHVVRAMELYRDRLIAYSLGNFATYYGISVAANRGIAPILITWLDEDGRFLFGRLVSTSQVRPNGPKRDPERRALKLIRNLSETAFPQGALTFGEDGSLKPAAQRVSAAPGT